MTDVFSCSTNLYHATDEKYLSEVTRKIAETVIVFLKTEKPFIPENDFWCRRFEMREVFHNSTVSPNAILLQQRSCVLFLIFDA